MTISEDFKRVQFVRMVKAMRGIVSNPQQTATKGLVILLRSPQITNEFELEQAVNGWIAATVERKPQ